MFLIHDNVWQGCFDINGMYPDIDVLVCLCETPPVLDSASKVQVTIHIPIADGPFPGIDWLHSVVSIIDLYNKKGKRVFVFCAAGISRSVMVAAAWLMQARFCDVDTALNSIAAVNPQLDPNPFFIRGLKEWREALYKLP